MKCLSSQVHNRTVNRIDGPAEKVFLATLHLRLTAEVHNNRHFRRHIDLSLLFQWYVELAAVSLNEQQQVVFII